LDLFLQNEAAVYFEKKTTKVLKSENRIVDSTERQLSVQTQ